MRAAVLFLVLSFAAFAAAQAKGGASAGTSGGGSVGTSAAGGTAASTGTGSPGMPAAPVSGPAAVAPTTDLGPTSSQPNGTGAVQGATSNTGAGNSGTFTNTGGFITNAPIGNQGSGAVDTGNNGYVPLLQTPETAFPSPLRHDLPITPAGISNNPSALAYSNVAGGGSYVPPITSGSSESLGDVARQYRAHGQQQAAHVYTNADIANLDRQPQMGSSIGPQGNTSAQTGSTPGQSPTTPSVNSEQQPSRNPALPGNDSQAPPPPAPPR